VLGNGFFWFPWRCSPRIRQSVHSTPERGIPTGIQKHFDQLGNGFCWLPWRRTHRIRQSVHSAPERGSTTGMQNTSNICKSSLRSNAE
jgi:hypothetical protein